jgi:hypothetical protein
MLVPSLSGLAGERIVQRPSGRNSGEAIEKKFSRAGFSMLRGDEKISGSPFQKERRP